HRVGADKWRLQKQPREGPPWARAPTKTGARELINICVAEAFGRQKYSAWADTQKSATTKKTKAAELWGLNQKREVEEVDLDGPKEAEVLVKLTASGLCHSDHHLVTGDLQMPLPAVGGHEGAGVVVDVGPGVTEVADGDPVVLSFIPACGRCTTCAR